MNFTSYAQNLEDVMLWRALSHVGAGFYIDAGAAWPNRDSVTQGFYEQGWSGINVEPNPALHALLQSERARDVNLALALGDQPGPLTLHVIDNTGLTSADPQIVESHRLAGWRTREITVDVVTLASLWEAHVPQGQDVHFLKVDVEGLEAQVLRGNDWQRYRPWVVVVEATKPLSQVECYEAWEPLLLSNGYVFVYADGLNRFYLAQERASLRDAFRYPPNTFDQFSRATEVSALQRVQALEVSNRSLKTEVAASRKAAAIAEQRCEALYQSTSWKLTQPMRSAAGLAYRAKSLPKRVARRAVMYGVAHPWLRRSAASILNRMPSLKRRLVRLATGAPAPRSRAIPLRDDQLSPRGREIQSTLLMAMAREQRGTAECES